MSLPVSGPPLAPEPAEVPAPPTLVASYSSLATFDLCPRQYAFRYVEQVPVEETPNLPFAFGRAAHAAFEAFTRERRERLGRGEAPPTREDLGRLFDEAWAAAEFTGQAKDEGFRRRVAGLLDRFWRREASAAGEVIAEEQLFELVLDPVDGAQPVVLRGCIDRVDRLRSGGIEVIDYKTGSPAYQPSVDDSLQLSIYALACRDALGLGTPERVTHDFPEFAARLSTVRTDAQLDAARAAILARVARIRAADFTATPGDACRWCDYRAMCPEAM